MAVIQAHGRGTRDIGQHGFLIIRQRSVLLRISLAGAVLLERTPVGVGAVLFKPLFDLVNRHSYEELLESVHLFAPDTGAHDVVLAPVSLRDPARDLLGELLLRIRGRTVHHCVVVRVIVVAALAGPAAEVRHGRTVVVRRRVLKLVYVDGKYLALAVKYDVCKHLVYAVHRRARIVRAGAHTYGIREAEALIGLRRNYRLLGGFRGRLRLGAVIDAGKGVLDGVYNTVAGIRRTGYYINVW